MSKGRFSIWFKRILILYAVWMVLYLPFWLPDSHASHTKFIIRTIQTIIFGYFHLWYLAGLIGAAIMLLLLIRLTRNNSATVGTAAIITFLTGLAIQYAANYDAVDNAALLRVMHLEWAARNFLFFAFPFFSLGYLLRKHSVVERLSIGWAAVLAIAGLLLILFEATLNFHKTIPRAPFDILASLALACPAIFIFFMKIELKTQNKETALYSTGIYLVHIFVMLQLIRFTHMSPTMLTIVTACISAFAAYVLMRLNRKIPYVL